MNAQVDELHHSISFLKQQQGIGLTELFERSKRAYAQDRAPTFDVRVERLRQLKANLLKNKHQLATAMAQDFGHRTQFDSLMADVMPSINHINYTVKKLKGWMKPERRHASLMFTPSKVTVNYQPLGVVGVISPWNFPVLLALSPVITAVAAGNKVMLKVSEYTPNTNAAMRVLFNGLEDEIVMVEGGPEVAGQFSALPFDHLLFTGSTMVGRLVAKAAADNLTPVTLELGGKSPVIVSDKGSLNRAVDAVLFGKCLNAGQICVSPDYVLIQKGLEQEFIEGIKKRYIKSMGKKSTMTTIINDKQLERLHTYLEQAEQLGAELIPLSVKLAEQESSRLMQPTLLRHVTDEMSIMQDEIFGPLLPIVPFDTLPEAIAYVNERPRPLALYLFSNDKDEQSQVLKQTHSGGVAINDTIVHVVADDAPFGGVGPSGMGHYHGKEGFLTFSKAKTVLRTPGWLPRSRLLLKFPRFAAKVLDRVFVR